MDCRIACRRRAIIPLDLPLECVDESRVDEHISDVISRRVGSLVAQAYFQSLRVVSELRGGDTQAGAPFVCSSSSSSSDSTTAATEILEPATE